MKLLCGVMVTTMTTTTTTNELNESSYLLLTSYKINANVSTHRTSWLIWRWLLVVVMMLIQSSS